MNKLTNDKVPAPCQVVDDLVREARLSSLQQAVRGQEDQFLVEGGEYECGGGPWQVRVELNEYAIAEWVYGLLERQRETLIGEVEKALSKENVR